LIDLFDQKFLPAGGDVLAEFYDDKWVRFADGDAFEPGHHFEWVWLLTRHSAMTGMAVDERIDGLLRKAKLGVDADGRVVDQMVANGPVARTYRLWPAMEAAKAFAVAQGSMARPAGVADVLSAAWQTFIELAVSGGWIDRVDDNGTVLVDHMPASSLYHICTALDFLR
jgi:mannose-6-phosphate isomerase